MSSPISSAVAELRLPSPKRLGRNWLGTDISHLAIKLILERIIKPIPDNKRIDFQKGISIHGFPKISPQPRTGDKDKKGRYEFQEWVVEFSYWRNIKS
jgi:hypothetical protein